MSISVLDIFSIGVGPSSSHTVGPMRAANRFVSELSKLQMLQNVKRVQIDLYGSLALTGKGHKTDVAVLVGLEACVPEMVEPNDILIRLERVIEHQILQLGNQHPINFDCTKHLLFHKNKFLSQHANGLTFTAFDVEDNNILEKTYYSVGGGFIIDDAKNETNTQNNILIELKYPFNRAKELLHLCRVNSLTIAELMLSNENAWRSEQQTKAALLNIVEVMEQSIERGCQQTGVLPGGLNVRRRAPALFAKLNVDQRDKENAMKWLNLYAIAVNEENASGGRIVTAPTNGAAGIIPATLHYYQHFIKDANEDGVINFLLTAAAIGILYKKGASLSAAEVGCQGEVGVAASMAAGALTAVLGGNLDQIENAAEMAMEHNLGLTCDPMNGLVQIPCIERNAMGAVQAVNCAELALLEDGEHHVSLDKVIATMLRTGKDMQSIYKETSLGGLAVNIPEC